jgi:hypothetical protein
VNDERKESLKAYIEYIHRMLKADLRRVKNVEVTADEYKYYIYYYFATFVRGMNVKHI